MLGIYLRKIVSKDCYLLYKWANDEQVRKNSFKTEKIKYENHVKWFEDKFNSSDTLIYILMHQRFPVGQIRVHIYNGVGVIDYSIDEKYRGKGFGSKLLCLFEKEIFNSNLEIHKLIGEVKNSNTSSQRAFEKNGYSKNRIEEYIEYNKLIK